MKNGDKNLFWNLLALMLRSNSRRISMYWRRSNKRDMKIIKTEIFSDTSLSLPFSLYVSMKGGQIKRTQFYEVPMYMFFVCILFILLSKILIQTNPLEFIFRVICLSALTNLTNWSILVSRGILNAYSHFLFSIDHSQMALQNPSRLSDVNQFIYFIYYI